MEKSEERSLEETKRFGIASLMSKMAMAASVAIDEAPTPTQQTDLLICCAAMLVSFAEDAGVPRADIIKRLESDLTKIQADYYAALAEQQGSAN